MHIFNILLTLWFLSEGPSPLPPASSSGKLSLLCVLLLQGCTGLLRNAALFEVKVGHRQLFIAPGRPINTLKFLQFKGFAPAGQPHRRMFYTGSK